MDPAGKKTEASDQKLETLRKVPFFSGLPASTLQVLSGHCLERRYGRGEMIFGEGDRCTGLFIVHSGAVKVFKTSGTGRELVLSIERRYRPIAELPVFDDGDHPASAMALEDTRVLILPKEIFERLCHQNPGMALGVLKAVSARYRRLVHLVEDLTFREVSHRLAGVLVEQVAGQGERTPAGWVFDLQMNNQELASRVGTVRELVSRTLNRFHEQGIIRLEGRRVTVPDLDRLRREMEAYK